MQLIERLEGRTLFASFTATSTADLIADINAANSTAAADTITLIAGKVYTLTAVNNTGDGATGLPSITKPLTIIGNGGVIERSSTAGTPAFRLLDVNAGASLTLKNLTLRNGRITGHSRLYQTPRSGPTLSLPTKQPHGGAIFNQGTLALEGVTLHNNVAAGTDGSTYVGTTVTLNYAAGNGKGGAIYSTGTLRMTGCTVRNNSAVGGGLRGSGSLLGLPATGSGGGIYISAGTASITGGTLTTNTATGGANLNRSGTSNPNGGHGRGGALAVEGGTVSMTGAVLTTNTARGGTGGAGSGRAGNGGNGLGGGIFVWGGTTTLTLRNLSIQTNRAIGGTRGSNLLPNGTTIYGTAGQGIGGGIYIDAAVSTPIVKLNAFTKTNTKLNTATTSHADIFGTYTIIV